LSLPHQALHSFPTRRSSDLVWRNTLRTEVVLMGTRRIRSYEPATGKVLWELTTEEGAGRAYTGGGKAAAGGCKSTPIATPEMIRSEEHTSELQSRGHLVCRL